MDKSVKDYRYEIYVNYLKVKLGDVKMPPYAHSRQEQAEYPPAENGRGQQEFPVAQRRVAIPHRPESD